MSLVKFDYNDRTRDRNSSTMLEITSLNCMKTFGKGSCLTRQLFWHKNMFCALLSRVTMTMFCFLMRLGGSSPFVTILDAGSWVDFWGVHICGANNRKQDKTEALLPSEKNLGGWHLSINMSLTRFEISLGKNWKYDYEIFSSWWNRDIKIQREKIKKLKKDDDDLGESLRVWWS